MLLPTSFNSVCRGCHACPSQDLSVVQSFETGTAPAGVMARIFFGVSCGQDHVAAEAARLLLRLFMPAAGRAGSPPWNLPKPEGSLAKGEASSNTPEDTAMAQQAKVAALRQPGRSAQI